MSRPRLSLNIAFDADVFETDGIATSNDTFADDNTDAAIIYNPTFVYAGFDGIQMTSNSAGVISVNSGGFAGTVRSNSRYLYTSHFLPSGDARQVEISVFFRDETELPTGSSVYLQRQDEGFIRSDGWVKISFIVTTPNNTDHVFVKRRVLGVGAEETHWIDDHNFEYIGQDLASRIQTVQTSSGRNYERDEYEAGTATFVLKNEDGLLTPNGKGSGSPYQGNITVKRNVKYLIAKDGCLYPRWAGYTSRWEQTHPGSRYATVTLECTDMFRFLSNYQLEPPYQQEVLYDEPSAYFPMNEGTDTLVAGNISGSGGTIELYSGKYGSSDTAFGADGLLPEVEREVFGEDTADDNSSSVNFNPSAIDGRVTTFQFTSVQVPGLVPEVTGWSVEMILAPGTESPALSEIIFGTYLPGNAGEDVLSGFQLKQNIFGSIELETTAGVIGGTSDNYRIDHAVHIVINYRPGGTYGTVDFYVDNNNLFGFGLVLTSSPFHALGPPTRAGFGGYIDSFVDAADSWYVGRGGHLAFYDHYLTFDRVEAHYIVAIYGGYSETEGNRLGGLANFARIPEPKRQIDVGLVELADRRWSQTSALVLMQLVTGFAAGHLFIGVDGKLTYRNRNSRTNTATLATFDGIKSVLWQGYAPSTDDANFANVAIVQQPNRTAVVARDTTSIEANGEYIAAPKEVELRNSSDLLSLAQLLVSDYSDTQTRLDSVLLDPEQSEIQWDDCLRLQLGEKIRVGNLPIVQPDYPITESFNTFDSTKWGRDYPLQVLFVSGQLEIETLASSGASYQTLYSLDLYDLSNSSISVKVIDVGNQAIASFQFFPILISDETSHNSHYISIQNDDVHVGIELDGTFIELATQPYDSLQHIYFRIREDSDVIYYEYSSDGLDWNLISKTSTVLLNENARVHIRAGHFNTETLTTRVIVDDLNIYPNQTDYLDVFIEKIQEKREQNGLYTFQLQVSPVKQYRFFARLNDEIYGQLNNPLCVLGY